MTEKRPQPSDTIAGLIDIMARLRAPEGGCPWDVEQSFATIAPYTVEEAYEVADAIERDDRVSLKEELGDLLFQVVFHAQMAREEGAFEFSDVVQSISDKMVRRHPHVFGDKSHRTAEEQTLAWEEQKAAERKDKGKDSLLDDVPIGLPGLTRAVKLQKRAGRIGFDWPNPQEVLSKVNEETAELVEAIDEHDANHIEEEFGDLLFVIANLSRHLKVDPETAIRRANAKFTRRFSFIEEKLKRLGRINDATLDEMEELWLEAKAMEKS